MWWVPHTMEKGTRHLGDGLPHCLVLLSGYPFSICKGPYTLVHIVCARPSGVINNLARALWASLAHNVFLLLCFEMQRSPVDKG